MTPCEIGNAPDRYGYSTCWVDGRKQRAHRVAWEQANGPIPAGMLVCHTCDNRPCINVEHLFLGTPKDNSVDAVNKGRHANAAKPHCPQGHPYVLRSNGGRRCRVCDTVRMARSRQMKRSAEPEDGAR